MLALIGDILYLFLLVLFAYSVLSWLTYVGTSGLRLAGLQGPECPGNHLRAGAAAGPPDHPAGADRRRRASTCRSWSCSW